MTSHSQQVTQDFDVSCHLPCSLSQSHKHANFWFGKLCICNCWSCGALMRRLGCVIHCGAACLWQSTTNWS